MAVKTYIAAITEAMDLALEKDDKRPYFGEDVGKNGGSIPRNRWLKSKYGDERVFDAPLS